MATTLSVNEFFPYLEDNYTTPAAARIFHGGTGMRVAGRLYRGATRELQACRSRSDARAG